MLVRGVWPVARPDMSVLQESSKGPSLEGPCNSQPLAREVMDQAVSMPNRVRIYSEASPIRGPSSHHPPCKASAPAVTRGPPVTAAVRVHSTLHCTPVSPVHVVRGPWLRQWRASHASRVRRGNCGTSGKTRGGARLVLGTRTPSIPIPIPTLYKLRPCPTYNGRRDRIDLVPNLISYEM